MNFEQILFYLTSQGAFYVYTIAFISAFIENIFPPFPGDAVTLAAAYLAGRGEVGYIPVFAAVVAGGLLGAMTLYYLGRIKGRTLFVKYDKYYLRLENLNKIEKWFQRYNLLILLFSRFVAGARSVIAVAAGVGNVPVRRMVCLTLISFCLWNGLLIGGLYALKSNWGKLIDIVKSYNMVIIVASAAMLLIWLVIIYSRSTLKK